MAAGELVLAAVGEQDPELTSDWDLLVERAAQLPLHLQHALLPDAEIRIHRVGLIDRGQQGGVCR